MAQMLNDAIEALKDPDVREAFEDEQLEEFRREQDALRRAFSTQLCDARKTKLDELVPEEELLDVKPLDALAKAQMINNDIAKELEGEIRKAMAVPPEMLGRVDRS